MVWRTFEILPKNRNYGQKTRFWSKTEILVKHRNFLNYFLLENYLK